MGLKIDAKAVNERRLIQDAEDRLKHGKPRETIDILQSVEVNSHSHARKILIDALRAEEEWVKLSNVIRTPNTVEESILLITAFIRSGQFDKAQIALKSSDLIDTKVRQDLQEILEKERLIRQS